MGEPAGRHLLLSALLRVWATLYPLCTCSRQPPPLNCKLSEGRDLYFAKRFNSNSHSSAWHTLGIQDTLVKLKVSWTTPRPGHAKLLEHQLTGQMNCHPILTKPNPHGYAQTAPSSHCHPMPTTRCNTQLWELNSSRTVSNYFFFLLNPFY